MQLIHKEKLIFEVAGMRLGLDLKSVDLVVPISKITKVPNAPEYISGLAAIRGKVMSVVDLAKRLGVKSRNPKYFLICDVRGSETAIIIDKPVEAYKIYLRKLDKNFKKTVVNKFSVDEALFGDAFEIVNEENEKFSLSGRAFLDMEADKFISDKVANSLAGNS